MKILPKLLLCFFLPLTAFSAEPNFEGVCINQVTPLKTPGTFNILPCGFKSELKAEEINALSVSWVVKKTFSRTPTYDLVPTPNNPLYDERFHAPSDSEGCQFIGDYQRTIMKVSGPQLRCGGGASEVVLCQASISCKRGSALHKKFGLEDTDFEGNITCLAKDRLCPSLAACASDEEYKKYQGETSKLVDELKDQSTVDR